MPLPDRLATDPRSAHYVAAVFEHDIGIRFIDMERSDVGGIVERRLSGVESAGLADCCGSGPDSQSGEVAAC
jgi:hypothetical protein